MRDLLRQSHSDPQLDVGRPMAERLDSAGCTCGHLVLQPTGRTLLPMPASRPPLPHRKSNGNPSAWHAVGTNRAPPARAFGQNHPRRDGNTVDNDGRLRFL